MPAAAYVKTRTDPDKFEIFSSFLPTYVDPVVIPYLNATYPGFWSDPRKEELVKQLATDDRPEGARRDLEADPGADLRRDALYQVRHRGRVRGAAQGRDGRDRQPRQSRRSFFNVAPPAEVT